MEAPEVLRPAADADAVDNADRPENAGTFDVVIVGAGPNGIASAVHAQRAGLQDVLLSTPMEVVSRHLLPLPSGGDAKMLCSPYLGCFG